MKRYLILTFAIVIGLGIVPSGCRKSRPPRPKVVNPLIDSLEKFEPVYVESVERGPTGLELFMKIISPETATARETVPASKTQNQTPARAETAGQSSPAGAAQKKTLSDSGLVTLVGTVRRVTLEGGFWGFEADDGKHYDPLNLPPDLQKDGQRAKLWVKIRDDVATTHIWGTSVHVVRFALPKQ